MVTQALPYAAIRSFVPGLVMDRGGVYLQPGSPYWMIRFRHRNRQIRESSKTTSRREALAFLKRRMAEFGLGRGVALIEIPTLAEAADSLLSHITASRKSGHAIVRSHLRSLLEYFGSEIRIAEIQPDLMEGFVASRRAKGLKDASVYNELSTLRRCLRLQWKRHRLMILPAFPMPSRGIARRGFFTLEEVKRLCQVLPAHGAAAVRFAWETGWRRGEIFGLRWKDVDWATGIIYLRVTKNGEPRQLPFAESPILVQIIRERRASASAIELKTGRPVAHVFHYCGRQLPEGLRRCWTSACQKVGLESRLFHDLRRSFIQRCEDSGVARSSAMKITGHRTEAVYARYAFAPRASISAALRKLAVETENDGDHGVRKTRARSKIAGPASIV